MCKSGIARWFIAHGLLVELRHVTNGQTDRALLNAPSIVYCLLLSWHAPVGMRSDIRRHQPPQRTVLSQVDCFVQCEVIGSQVSLDGIQPSDTGMPWWSLPVLWWGSH